MIFANHHVKVTPEQLYPVDKKGKTHHFGRYQTNQLTL